MRKLTVILVKIYQKIKPVLFFPSCRFYPTCSQYCLEAVNQHGFLRGLYKAFLRIVRCSPLTKGGYDPVKQ